MRKLFASSSFARRVGNAAPVIGVGHASQLHAFQDDKQTALIAGQHFNTRCLASALSM